MASASQQAHGYDLRQFKKVKWIEYAMDFSEIFWRKKFNVKEVKFVGQSRKWWSGCEEVNSKGKGIKGSGTSGSHWLHGNSVVSDSINLSADILNRHPQCHPLICYLNINIMLFLQSHCWKWVTWSFILILFSNILIIDTF